MALSAAGSVKAPVESSQGTDASQSAAKLKKSARAFEAILLQNWLEKMKESFVGSSESQDAAHDTVSSLGTQAIATALAARGGIGIANLLLRQLQPSKPGGQVRDSKDPGISDSSWRKRPSR